MTAPAVEAEVQEDVKTEHGRLMEYTRSDLLTIAEDMSLTIVAKANKTQIVDAILEKTNAARANPDSEPGALEPELTEEEVPAKAPESEEAVVPEMANMNDIYLTDYKHLMFTVGADHRPENGLVDAAHANSEIELWFERNYDVVKFMTAGHDPRGHRMIWVFEKVDKAKFSEAKIIQRTLTSVPDPGRGTITGFQADAYISQLVRVEDWTLLGICYNGDDIGGGANTGGVYMVWMLAR